MIRNPVTLAPLAEDTLAPVQALAVKPFQSVFSGRPADFMQAPEAGFDPHTILKEGEVVGMFRIQTNFHMTHTFANSDTPAITNWLIDQDKQGQGMGTESARMMQDYLRGATKMARGCYMLVHQRNEGGYRAATRGGWTDTGIEHTLAITGPQHILWMPFR